MHYLLVTRLKLSFGQALSNKSRLKRLDLKICPVTPKRWSKCNLTVAKRKIENKEGFTPILLPLVNEQSVKNFIGSFVLPQHIFCSLLFFYEPALFSLISTFLHLLPGKPLPSMPPSTWFIAAPHYLWRPFPPCLLLSSVSASFVLKLWSLGRQVRRQNAWFVPGGCKGREFVSQ